MKYSTLFSKSANSLFFVTVVVGFFSLSSCTSNKMGYEETVVANIDKSLKTPDWATGQTAMFMDANDVIFVNLLQMDGDARPDACMRSAELSGSSSMLRYIKTSLTSSGQLSEDGVSSDPGYESLTAFLSQGNISGIKIKERYWEKVAVSQSAARTELRMRCAVKVAIDKSLLEKQMKQAVNGEKSGNPEIRNQLLEAQKNFISQIPNQTTPQ